MVLARLGYTMSARGKSTAESESFDLQSALSIFSQTSTKEARKQAIATISAAAANGARAALFYMYGFDRGVVSQDQALKLTEQAQQAGVIEANRVVGMAAPRVRYHARRTRSQVDSAAGGGQKRRVRAAPAGHPPGRE